MKIKILSLLGLICFASPAMADPLVQQFKDPAFNGVGWSNHVIAVQNIEQNNKQANENALASAQAAAAAAAANTPLNKFISLFTSQVYAQLATQLSNNLFQTGSTASNSGIFNLDGNTISYVKTGTNVTLTVVDSTGNQTVVTVPIATFAF
jgi:hypothetical protein